MANKIDIFIQHALRTFRVPPIKKMPECSLADLNELKALADEIKINDIVKLKNWLKSKEMKDLFLKKKSYVDYLPVYEDDSISVGVFLLRQGGKLPVHDHPGMYGIIKVLEGIFKITSYSLVDIDKSSSTYSDLMFYNQPLKVIKHPEIKLTNKDEPCMLTPTERNIHEVECIEGPAAFLDILSPPYENGGTEMPRTCHYFEEITEETDREEDDSFLRLVQVPNPF